jgi:hypothetical protein
MLYPQCTGQPEVVLFVAPAPGTGDDMLYMQCFIDILLMGPAVTTAIARLLYNTYS